MVASTCGRAPNGFDAPLRMAAPSVERTITAVYRIESAKLIAALTRMLRDVGRAEELAQDALVAALEQWPTSGVPENPGAWLMAAAKHRAIDELRRGGRSERTAVEVGQMEVLKQEELGPLDERLDEDVGDDVLRLLFIACHPVLSREARAALTLRLLGGLSTDEIARAFLVPEPTVAQRIVRAKKTLAEAQVPFELPAPAQLNERLSSVLEVIYLVFNEGYSATAGNDWLRPELCEDAMRLGRVLANVMPSHSEVHGLLALMELQASRAAARTTPEGEPILLLEQNRARWNQLLIRRGLEALSRAVVLGGARGPYALQAAIAACHARAKVADDTDWRGIATLYDTLLEVMPSPIVALNRAVAHAMAFGPAAGLEQLTALDDAPQLQGYHLLPSVRGDLLFKLGRKGEAREQFEQAAALTRNEREKMLLRARAAACDEGI